MASGSSVVASEDQMDVDTGVGSGSVGVASRSHMDEGSHQKQLVPFMRYTSSNYTSSNSSSDDDDDDDDEEEETAKPEAKDKESPSIAPTLNMWRLFHGFHVEENVNLKLREMCVPVDGRYNKAHYLTTGTKVETAQTSVKFLTMTHAMMSKGNKALKVKAARKEKDRTVFEKKLHKLHDIHPALPLALFDKPSVVNNLNMGSIAALEMWYAYKYPALEPKEKKKYSRVLAYGDVFNEFLGAMQL
ncbi:hypothetical protein HDU87_003501, partial [Geranomyces variabilis]